MGIYFRHTFRIDVWRLIPGKVLSDEFLGTAPFLMSQHWSGKNPLPTNVTQICVAIWRHKATDGFSIEILIHLTKSLDWRNLMGTVSYETLNNSL